MADLPFLPGDVRVIDLEQPRHQRMPVHPSHRPGYAYFLHRRHEDGYAPQTHGPRTGSSGIVTTPDHSGTHIDALCHQAEDLLLHGGVPAGDAASQAGYATLGVEEIPPIVARGVLLDLAAHLGVDQLPAGRIVTAADLDACARATGVTVVPGDVLIVRTGSDRDWDDPDRYLAGAGMSGDASEWAAAAGVVAVGADNLAWDALGVRDPVIGSELPGHVVLLVRHGIYIIENLALAELAAGGHSTFVFVCLPLKMVGATGSPVRPVALVPA